MPVLSGNPRGALAAGGHGQRGMIADKVQIAPAMIGSLELDNLVFAGVGPRQANGCHGAFGALTGETNQVHRRHQTLDRLADLVVELMRKAEVVSLGADFFHHSLDDVVGGVAEYQRTVAETVVNVFVAVHIPNPSTGGVVNAQFNTGTQASVGTLSAGDAAADTLKQLL